MIIKFKIYENNSDIEKQIRTMSWLYMLFVYNRNQNNIGLDESWLMDKRMGITFGSIINELIDLGYAKLENNNWKITNKGIESLYDFFKPPKTIENWLNYDNTWLKQYDITGYYGFEISKIPSELFERRFSEESERKMDYTINRSDYEKIANWWVKYQRGIVGWWTQMNKYLGLKNELIPNVDTMVLYRGLNIKKYDYCKSTNGIKKVTDLIVGDQIFCNKPSWTLDKKIAKLFARGKKGWGDMRSMRDDEIGIILKHTFKYYELLLDTNWVQNNKYLKGETVLPAEMEVIVKPKNRMIEIIDIFKSD